MSITTYREGVGTATVAGLLRDVEYELRALQRIVPEDDDDIRYSLEDARDYLSKAAAQLGVSLETV